MLNAFWLNVMALSCVIVLTIVRMLCVVMMCVITVSVVAPFFYLFFPFSLSKHLRQLGDVEKKPTYLCMVSWVQVGCSLTHNRFLHGRNTLAYFYNEVQQCIMGLGVRIHNNALQ